MDSQTTSLMSLQNVSKGFYSKASKIEILNKACFEIFKYIIETDASKFSKTKNKILRNFVITIRPIIERIATPITFLGSFASFFKNESSLFKKL